MSAFEDLTQAIIEDSLADELFDKKRFYEYLKMNTSKEEYKILKTEPMSLVLELYRNDFINYLTCYCTIYYQARVKSYPNTHSNRAYSLSEFEKETRRNFLTSPLQHKINKLTGSVKQFLKRDELQVNA
jgi:hypothetical protein